MVHCCALLHETKHKEIVTHLMWNPISFNVTFSPLESRHILSLWLLCFAL